VNTVNPAAPPRSDSEEEEVRLARRDPQQHRGSRERDPQVVLSQTTRLIITCAGILILFYAAKSVVLPVLLAWVASMALYQPMTWLRAHKIPAPIGAGLLLGILTAGLIWGLVSLGKPVSNWIQSAPESLPRLREKYQRYFRPFSRLFTAVQNVDEKTPNKPPHPEATPIASGGGAIAGTVFTWTGSLFTGAVETSVLVFLLLATGDRFTPKLARALQRRPDKQDAAEMTRQIQQNISKYLFAVSVINSVLGACVGFSLYLAGMPNAAMWGVMAAIFNYIPYFGPIAGIIVVAVAGLLSFDTIGRGLLPAAIYLAWHVLEADCVTPFLLGRRFRLNPVVIFVALMFFAWLWGIVGGLLAMPILVTLKVICKDTPALSSLGDLLEA
jgi:predicted PurR-regulated permease PerM